MSYIATTSNTLVSAATDQEKQAVGHANAYEENKTFTEFDPSSPTLIYPTQKAIVPKTHKSVFLAGAIDQGKAPDWQRAMFESFQDAGLPIVTFNPRRPNWDSTLKQEITNDTFKAQVDWELDALDDVDYIAMFLPEGTLAPISLLELGIYARSGRLFVGCSKAFYRRGNVEIVCQRLGIPLFDTREELEEEIKSRVRKDLQLA